MSDKKKAKEKSPKSEKEKENKGEKSEEKKDEKAEEKKEDNDEESKDDEPSPSDATKENIEEADSHSSADDCCVCPCFCCCYCTCRRKRRRKKRELMSAFIRRRLDSKVDIRDGDTWSLNNVRRDVYYEEYQRMKALQVEKEKILHEMFVEDLDKKKNDIIDNKQD